MCYVLVPWVTDYRKTWQNMGIVTALAVVTGIVVSYTGHSRSSRHN
jgi:hypothetical protein